MFRKLCKLNDVLRLFFVTNILKVRVGEVLACRFIFTNRTPKGCERAYCSLNLQLIVRDGFYLPDF